MVGQRTVVKKPFLSGNTIRIRFRILDELAAGFQPDTLTLSIYDVEPIILTGTTVYRCLNAQMGEEVTSVVVNAQTATDVLAYVDSTGQVEVFLTPEDTTVDVPSRLQAIYQQRRILFTWTWGGSPAKRASHEIFVSIAPDRATVAA